MGGTGGGGSGCMDRKYPASAEWFNAGEKKCEEDRRPQAWRREGAEEKEWKR
jgi:hypothetical protein